MKTDIQLQHDVLAELKWEPSVNAARIGVEVSDGVVTLAGHVNSYAEKWDAERAAQRVSGVKALAVELDVKLSVTSRRTDTDIAGSAENALEWSTYTPKGRVKVMVENGWVTLTGDVDWEYQRKTAQKAVQYLMGVTGVSNNIALKPEVSLSAVKADIEAALKRRASGDARKISVEVDGAQVTLSGTVHSWGERDTARESAWSTPGVRQVVDKMAIAF
jgi:osmotically-inducible protein OsmY